MQTAFQVLMTSRRNKHQCDYGIIDGSFHKNLEIHVSNGFSKSKELVLQEIETSILRCCTVITQQTSV